MLILDNTTSTPTPLFKGQPLRSVMIGEDPWFVAVDVAKCIGAVCTYSMYRPLSPDQRGTQTLRTPGGMQGLVTISESGLYSAIMRAQRKRPQVIEFQDWVTREVLPSIRKTGGYLLNEQARETAHADTREVPPELMGFVSDLLARITGLESGMAALLQVSEKPAPWEIWTGSSGKTHIISDLPESHLRNILNHKQCQQGPRRDHVAETLQRKTIARRLEENTAASLTKSEKAEAARVAKAKAKAVAAAKAKAAKERARIEAEKAQLNAKAAALIAKAEALAA